MNCEKAIDLISAETDAALSASEQAELELHLAECADCRRYRDALRMIDEAVSEPVEPPETLLFDVMSELRLRETEAGRGARRRHSFAARWGTLAACAVLVAGTLLAGLRPGGFLRQETAVMSAAAADAMPNRIMNGAGAVAEESVCDAAAAEAAPAPTEAPRPEPKPAEEARGTESLMLPHDPEGFAADRARSYLESELGMSVGSVTDWDAPAVEICSDDCRVCFTAADGTAVTVVMNGSGELLEIIR